MTKICPKCNIEKSVFEFNAVSHGQHKRRDRVCAECRLKYGFAPVHVGMSERRRRELSLIKSPFLKVIKSDDTRSAFLDSDTV